MASPKSGNRKSATARLKDRAKATASKAKAKAGSAVDTYKKKRLIKKANKTAIDL